MQHQPQVRQMALLDWAMLIALSLLWGASFFFLGTALKELPAFTIVALRVGLASAVLLILVWLMGLHMPRDRQVWAAYLGLGLLNNGLPFCLVAWGQMHIASGLASILNATTPLATLILAHMFTADEKMNPRRIAGVVIGFAGVIVIIGPEFLAGLGKNVLAQLACLAAALSYACGGVFGRRLKRMGISPLIGATGQVTVSAMLLTPLTLVLDRPWNLQMPGLATWGAVIAMAIFSTALAYILYFRILASAGATNLLLVTMLIPLSAITLGTLLLGERLLPQHFYGMACIGIGLVVMDGRLQKNRSGSAFATWLGLRATTWKR